MKKAVILLLIFFNLASYSQNIASLKKNFTKALSENDTAYYLLSQKIVNYYRFSCPDSAILFLNKTIIFAQKQNNKTELVNSLVLKADILSEKQQFDEAITSYFNALNLLSYVTNDKKYVNIIIKLSNSLHNSGFKNDIAKKYLIQASEIANELDYTEAKINIYNILSNIYAEKNSFDSAQIYIDISIKHCNKINNPELTAKTYYYLSLILKLKKDYLKSITYLKKSISISENENNKSYFKLHLAELYSQMGYYSAASNFLSQVIEYYIVTNNKIGQIKSFLEISKLYKNQNKLNEAIENAQKALKISKKLNILNLQIKSYYFLSSIYSENEQIDLALFSYKKYSTLRDSIFSENSKKESELLYNNYVLQLKLKDQQIKNRQKENQFLKNKQQSLAISILGISAILLIIIIFILLRFYNIKIKSEFRLKQLTEATFEGIIIHDGYKIIEVNDKFCTITNFSRQELIGRTILSILPESSQEKVKKRLSLKKAVYYQMDIYKKDKSIFKAEVLSKPYTYKGVAAKVVSVRDLTELRSIKEKLYETKEKFEVLIETSPDGVVITDLDGVITYVSPAFTKLFNSKDYKDFKEKKLSDYVIHLYKNKINTDLKNIKLGKYRGVTEYIAIKNDGTEFYIECNGNTIKDFKNEISGIFMIVRDISERKIVENALIESESRFKGLFNSAKDAIIILSNDFKIIDANPYTSTILNHSFDELINKDFREFFSSDFNKIDLTKLEASDDFIETYIYIKNRKRIYIQFSISEIDYPEEQFFLITIRDLTIFKRQEENLRRIATKLQESNATKDKMFSIIGHDLRGPIGNLKTMIEFIAENPEEFDTSELVNIISSMRDTSSQSYELLENLLSWAKTQQNLHEFKPDIINAVESITNTVNFSRHIAKTKNISIDIVAHKNCFVIADENMIKAIVRNLLSNAIKFSNENSKIIVEIIDNEENILVKVKDEGVGISDENLQKIFKEGNFVTTYGTKNEKGTGLGLKLCYDFVKKNNGKIWVESTINKGTTFSFTIKKA